MDSATPLSISRTSITFSGLLEKLRRTLGNSVIAARSIKADGTVSSRFTVALDNDLGRADGTREPFGWV
jgi:hypothetical protein